MAKLILVRHGESEGNRDRRFTATPAVGLTEFGRQQAHGAARRIAKLFKPERVIASPYLRARHTGEIIASELSMPLEIQQGLHERSFGYLAGHPYEAVENDPTLKADGLYFWRPEGGESYEDVRRRVGPILDLLAAENHGRELVIVSHGGVMLSLWAHVTGRWEDARLAPNCGIVLVEHNGISYQPPRFIED
jgi:ribonuclease H / adenosylcobalamin/alpha-ribazole phosphatase